MTVDFYFNAEDRLQVACRLAGKALAQNKRLLIYAPDAELAQRIDRQLWTWPAIGFVPHCFTSDALAAETAVLISSGEDVPTGCELLLNLSDDCPPHAERFARVLEIVEQAGKQAGRARYRAYRERGCPISDHDLGKEAADGE